ncbi:putative NRPS-like enzyme [Aspergillus fijiensis CBS 313.89]|uniref:Putative NRPS-like enzyme n=1 Tax=Aspergillus fijiensis CBS 313.89 TaxID=1448319 RepID=A0A8G1VTV4_9EURO|nr:putative NRPS-like enzyme [Aspergillus fijiensis CBS 313.89]RAK71433.1 putative NRPS-like enzyme [Aspergillus fijiensis CBS 313.89]
MNEKQTTDIPTEKECLQTGHRLLLNFLAGMAHEEPDKPVMRQLLPSATNAPSDRNEIILGYKGLMRLVDRVAWMLSRSLSPEDATSQTVGYLGPSDPRQLLIALAATKLDAKALLLSPRNSVSMHKVLLDESHSALLLCDNAFATAATEIRKQQDIDLLFIPDFVDLVHDSSPVESSPYVETWATSRGKPLVTLHTTGSTGNPSPVTMTHSALSSLDAQQDLSKKDAAGDKCQLEILAEAATVYMAFPLFHVAGFGLSCYLILSGCTLLFGYPRQPPSVAALKTVLKVSNVDGALLPTSIIDELSRNADLLKMLPKLRYIFGGGGTVSKSAGDIVVQSTRLLNGLGSTECGSFIQYPTDPTYWAYYHFHPWNGVKWRPTSDQESQGEDFELVLQRDDSCLQYQAVFQNFPHLREWRTKDVFRRHSHIPDYWEYRYRLDDLIVFSTGEKMNPLPVEAELRDIAGIKEALVVGNKRSCPAILLEMDASERHGAESDSIDRERTTIEHALKSQNAKSSRDSQIHDRMVIVASPSKPFIRTGKGSVHRNKTLELYETEIERLYGRTESSEPEPSGLEETRLCLSSEHALAVGLVSTIGKLESWLADIDVTTNIFAAGMDSKHAQILASVVSKVLADQGRGRNLPVEAVYENPSPKQMAGYIMRQTLPSEGRADDWKDFDSILDRCWPCDTDLAERHLGLSREIYQRLLGSVTDILHCQWAVDFSRPLAYFEPNIAGVKNLITFAHEARDKVHIIFLSSVATVKRWNSKTAVSETCLPSPKIAETGYGLSKVIAVRLLDQAVQGASMRVSICRLGQVAGPIQDGRDGKAHAWPLRDWFPTLLSSSVALGCLPDSLGSADQIDWLPVDTVADLLCDIISLSQHQQKNQQGSEYFHLVNPHRVQYASLVSCLAARLRLLNPELEVVPLSQWVAALEEKVNKAECIAGVQLLSFFQGLADASYQGSVLLETTLTKKRLPRLEECPPISPRCIDMWLRQWEMVPPSRKD